NSTTGSARPICPSAFSPVMERRLAWSSSPLLASLAFGIVDGACLAPSRVWVERDRRSGDRRRRGRSRGRNRIQLAVRALQCRLLDMRRRARAQVVRRLQALLPGGTVKLVKLLAARI